MRKKTGNRNWKNKKPTHNVKWKILFSIKTRHLPYRFFSKISAGYSTIFLHWISKARENEKGRKETKVRVWTWHWTNEKYSLPPLEENIPTSGNNPKPVARAEWLRSFLREFFFRMLRVIFIDCPMGGPAHHREPKKRATYDERIYSAAKEIKKEG